ncbi:MAG: ATP-binding protein [Lachnospiraceae bacterium]|nr:ATP-binding protein [Lachnospiraceae bacterium]
MRQEEAIQLSLEYINEIVLFFAGDGRISYANASAKKLLEYENQLLQCNIGDIFPGVFSAGNQVEEQVKLLLEQPKEMEAYRGNRTCFKVEATFSCFQDELFVCIATDTTEGSYLQRKIDQVQQEALDAAKVKTEFVANITHELRTPVNGILGNILELKDLENDPKKQRVLSLVERGCADMNAIINNILDFSKLEAGKFTIEKREFDFREMIHYVESNHRPKLSEKGLEFTVSIAPDIPQRVIGDELRIVQVLNNLLSNAAKFTSVGRVGVEVVKTSRIADRIELFFLVIDTGIGISKENQDKLFHSFSQVDASISRRFGGTGLGLNICKQLVELMDGSIHVESDEGKGSMFSFHIWVDLPENERNQGGSVAEPVSPGAYITSGFEPSLADYIRDSGMEAMRTYGTRENATEIERNLNKLILSVEMDNWEKAESFANVMRELTDNAPKEIKNQALRIKMAVQKEDYDKTAAVVDSMRELLTR